MQNFWDSGVWGTVNLAAVLMVSLIVANALKKTLKFLRRSLIPTSVLGGLLLLLTGVVFRLITGNVMLDTEFFGGSGLNMAETITYHCLALGFIATVFKHQGEKRSKDRTREIFNTGVTTVSTYLLQGVLGLGITIVWAMLSSEMFSAAGILLPFGYGQGTGQALNYGSIYEADYGFAGGKSFGLTVAAMGFLSAAIGGVIHLNVMRRRGKFTGGFEETAEQFSSDDIQKATEIPMNGSIDKLTVQLSFVFGTYAVTYLVIRGLGNLIPSFKSVLYGFNFLFGVIFGSLINMILNRMTRKTRIIQREYVNEFLMKRISGFFFDLMIVAGFAAIRIEVIGQYWPVLLTIGIVGAVSTYLYNKLVAKKLFEKYGEEQFMAMYGMLTGTASTGIVLLREIDRNFDTPVAENLVYQNFPAIVFGFPMMLLAALAPKQPVMTWIIVLAFFIVMNVILFRSFIFKRKK
ncbi:MAG: hypothetical protein IK001_00380 [Lachnospiraceae bacterium]|nr:hypothetical protein [Lachnospiraceae bacterium]